MTQRYDIVKCAPGERGPEGYEKYASTPSGVTLWRKDLLYGKVKRRPKSTDESPASEIETTDESPASTDDSPKEE